MNKKILGGLGALLLLTSVTTAQVVTAKTEKTQGFKTLEASYEKAKAEYVAKRSVIMQTDEYTKLRKARDYAAIRKLLSTLKSPDADFYPQFETLAKENEGKEAELEILLWMLGHTRDKAKNKVTMEILAERYIKDGFWATKLRLGSYYLGNEKGNALLARLAKENPDLEIQLAARYRRANGILRKAKADMKAAQGELDDILSAHPDSSPALTMKAPEFVKANLQIGMVAPEIIGTDLDGSDIKLSDYRGRVVVIDFWGDW